MKVEHYDFHDHYLRLCSPCSAFRLNCRGANCFLGNTQVHGRTPNKVALFPPVKTTITCTGLSLINWTDLLSSMMQHTWKLDDRDVTMRKKTTCKLIQVTRWIPAQDFIIVSVGQVCFSSGPWMCTGWYLANLLWLPTLVPGHVGTIDFVELLFGWGFVGA